MHWFKKQSRWERLQGAVADAVTERRMPAGRRKPRQQVHGLGKGALGLVGSVVGATVVSAAVSSLRNKG